jgi:hypothetical protein
VVGGEGGGRKDPWVHRLSLQSAPRALPPTVA